MRGRAGLVALFFLLALSAVVRAQDPPPLPQPKPKPKPAPGVASTPVATLQPATFRAGDVDQGESFRGSFRLQNSGSGSLRLLALDFGCPCARGKADRSVLAPGQSAEIPFDFETRGLEGAIAKILTVTLMDEGGKRHRVRGRIDVRVRPSWSLAPPQWSFGAVAPRAKLQHRFEIRRRDPIAAKAPGPRFKVRDPRLELVRDESGRATALFLRLEAPALPGGFRETFTLYADDPRCAARVIRVDGEVTGDIIVQPRALRFGQVPRGRGARRVITLISKSGRAFRIRAVRDRDVLDVKAWSPAAAVRHTLDVWLPKTLAPGAGRGTLLIEIEGSPDPLPVPFRYGVRGS